jgi:hypothetical protein
MRPSLTDTDKGYRALMKRLQEQAAPGLRVGVFGAKADAQHADSELTVGDIATIHEFGFEHVRGGYFVLERAWLRGYYDENEARLKEMVRRVAEAVAQGKMTREQGLNLIGLKISGEIKQRLQAGITPPLAESTIKAKGSSVPLIDSGQFIGSIAHEVVAGGVG